MTVATAPDFKVDWGGEVRAHWPDLFRDFGLDTGSRRLLEIGCFEGRTTLWMLEHTDPTSTVEVIDTFTGSPEFDGLHIDRDFKARFLHNISDHAGRVTVHEGTSADILPTLEGPFDLVFVDGSHVAADVWLDATLAWPLLRSGGAMVFDDYEWGFGPKTPRPAIDRFLREYGDQLALYRIGYQVTVAKT